MRKRVLGLALAFAASASLTGCAGLGDAEWAEPWESAEYGAYGGSPYRERVEMDDDEKEILAGAFVAEDEIRGGRLKEAERYALRQLRAVKDWLSERHPEEDFVVTSMSWQSSELEGASFTFVRRDELGLATEAVDNARYVHVARVHGDASSPVLAIDEDFHGESETFGAEDPVNDPLPAAPEEEGWDRWFDDADDDVGLMEEAKAAEMAAQDAAIEAYEGPSDEDIARWDEENRKYDEEYRKAMEAEKKGDEARTNWEAEFKGGAK